MKRMISKFQNIILFSIVFSLAIACKNTEEKETTIKPKAQVEIAGISYGTVKDSLTFFGSTFYRRHNELVASSNGYIKSVRTALGQFVLKGEVLYVLETKEQHALSGQTLMDDSLTNKMSEIKIVTPVNGIVSTFDKQQAGEYVMEGTQLCSISETTDFAFQINIPYEYASLVKTGTPCTIVLPDNSKHNAIFTVRLTNMNVQAQTQVWLAVSNDRLSLPENLIVKVLIPLNSPLKVQIIPRTCLLANEMMTEFWVMKLINDSTAVKTIVKTGKRDTSLVEILSPVFNVDDKLISKGNYGLPDTVNFILNH